jgi:hypothetical protein
MMTASHVSERHAFFTGVDLATYELSFLCGPTRLRAGTSALAAETSRPASKGSGYSAVFLVVRFAAGFFSSVTMRSP